MCRRRKHWHYISYFLFHFGGTGAHSTYRQEKQLLWVVKTFADNKRCRSLKSNFSFHHCDAFNLIFGAKSNPSLGYLPRNQMCLSINKHFIISSCQQLHTEMLHINHHSYSFWTEDLSQTRGGMVNFESEVAYDFLIPSTTRGQSVIVSQNNGIIALIFDIWNIKAVGLFRRGNDSWKKYKGAALFCRLFLPAYLFPQVIFSFVCLWKITSPFVIEGEGAVSVRCH